MNENTQKVLDHFRQATDDENQKIMDRKEQIKKLQAENENSSDVINLINTKIKECEVFVKANGMPAAEAVPEEG